MVLNCNKYCSAGLALVLLVVVIVGEVAVLGFLFIETLVFVLGVLVLLTTGLEIVTLLLFLDLVSITPAQYCDQVYK